MTTDSNHPLPYPEKRSSILCNYETEAKRFMGINLEMHAQVVQVKYTDMETEGNFLYAEGNFSFSQQQILLSECPTFLVSNSECS